MTVENTSNKQSYTGDGVTTGPYTFTFKTLAEWIFVYIEGVILSDTEYVLTLNGDQQASPGGFVTFNTAVTDQESIIILRTAPLTQESDYVPFSAFPSNTVESDFDKSTIINQQQQEEITRSIKISVDSDNNPTIPEGIPLFYWRWDQTGVDVEYVDLATNGAPTVSNLVTYETKANSVMNELDDLNVRVGTNETDIAQNAADIAAITLTRVTTTVITATDLLWAPDPNAQSITFELVGAGGGAGSCSHSGSGRGASVGGGGGAKSTNTIDGVTIEATYQIIIGIGGIGGVGAAVDGAGGTSSSIASTNVNTIAGGGDGGIGSSAPAGTLRNLPADGGVASGDGFLLNGDASTDGIINSGVIASTSNSGTSVYGGAIPSQEDANGFDGVNPGAGGGGAHTTSGAGSNRDGGDGSDGVCVITQYF